MAFALGYLARAARGQPGRQSLQNARYDSQASDADAGGTGMMSNPVYAGGSNNSRSPPGTAGSADEVGNAATHKHGQVHSLNPMYVAPNASTAVATPAVYAVPTQGEGAAVLVAGSAGQDEYLEVNTLASTGL